MNNGELPQNYKPVVLFVTFNNIQCNFFPELDLLQNIDQSLDHNSSIKLGTLKKNQSKYCKNTLKYERLGDETYFNLNQLSITKMYFLLYTDNLKIKLHIENAKLQLKSTPRKLVR